MPKLKENTLVVFNDYVGGNYQFAYEKKFTAMVIKKEQYSLEFTVDIERSYYMPAEPIPFFPEVKPCDRIEDFFKHAIKEQTEFWVLFKADHDLLFFGLLRVAGIEERIEGTRTKLLVIKNEVMVTKPELQKQLSLTSTLLKLKARTGYY